jgi:hypothetical protein
LGDTNEKRFTRAMPWASVAVMSATSLPVNVGVPEMTPSELSVRPQQLIVHVYV